jgi:hypothetical protein
LNPRKKPVTLVIDPKARLRAESKDGMGQFQRLMTNIWNFSVKIVLSLISFGIIFVFGLLLYILFYRKKLYFELWQGMANQYQELPEDRIYEVVLPKEYLQYWRRLNFRHPTLSTWGGSEINTGFNFQKHEGFINGEYRVDGHQLRIWGKK